jgi:hypothetical protein
MVEVLVVPGCPNEEAATGLVRGVLDDLGLTDVAVPVRMIDDPARAEQFGFTGSPTILIDGTDPFAEPGRAPALACRVYPTPTGLRGVPDASALRVALSAAISPGRSEP